MSLAAYAKPPRPSFLALAQGCEYAIAARLHDVCARGSRVHGYYLADCWLQLPTAVTRRTTGERKVMRKRLINLVCLYWYRSGTTGPADHRRETF